MNIMKDRLNDILKQADEMATNPIMQRMYGLMQQLVAIDPSHDS